MNHYNREQFETLAAVTGYLETAPAAEKGKLRESIRPYLDFRRRLEAFLERHFGAACSAQCYANARSACCSREGIITFFADVTVNALVSERVQLDLLMRALQQDAGGPKCVYLGPDGCRWQVRPIVCAMFLCDGAREQVFGDRPGLAEKWEALETERKTFTWPDRPVLFDRLEAFFLEAGISSPLMYLHNSPGMLRLKRKWQKR